MRRRQSHWALRLWLGMACFSAVRAAAAAECDLNTLRREAERAFPAYVVRDERAAGGVVTLVLAGREGAGTFGIGIRAANGMFFTSVMAAETDSALSAERARVGDIVASWYGVPAVQSALEGCGAGVVLAPADADAAVRSAAAGALGTLRWGESGEARIEIGTVLLCLTIIVLPMRRRSAVARPRPVTAWGVAGLLVVIVLAAVALAIVIAWRLAPETDEVVTLGARHQPFSTLLAWNVGGEPFNAPATSLLFALWLRATSGFFAARLLSIALIPLTAWLAYRAGRALGDRFVGIAFAGLVLVAPGYVRLAAIARGYSLLVLAICALLAAVGRSWRVPSRGTAVGLASVLGLWVSYLLWPLAFGAPWLARLDRRDRLRVTGALALMAVVLAPRIINGLATAGTKTDVFELQGPAAVLGHAFAIVGQATPGEIGIADPMSWFGTAIAIVLVTVAILASRRGEPRQFLFIVGSSLVLVAVPVLALLGGGRGIRERHVIGIAVVLALMAAMGWQRLIDRRRRTAQLAIGGTLLITLIALSARGNTTLVRGASGWIDQLPFVARATDLLVIVPRSAQMSVFAMLTGDSPLAAEGARWPPVCESDTEWWCRRAGPLTVLSVDAITADLVISAAALPSSTWVFSADGDSDNRGPAPLLDRCTVVFRDVGWRIVRCSAEELRG
jgi:hypothetical protein